MYQLISNLFIRTQENSGFKIHFHFITLQASISIMLNFLLATTKLFLGYKHSSLTLISDGVDNITNIVLSFIMILTYYLLTQKETIRYPFGKGRSIYIAQLIIGIIFIFIAVQLIKFTYQHLQYPLSMNDNTPIIIIIVIIGIILNEWLARFCFFIYKKTKSRMIYLEGMHNRLDNLTSVITLTTIICAYFGIYWVDKIGSVLFALIVFKSGVSVLLENLNQLLGSQPEAYELETITTISKRHSHILGIHEIIIHSYGYNKMISCHIELDSSLSLQDAHDICDEFEQDILHLTGFIMVTHPDPVDINNPIIKDIYTSINLMLLNKPNFKNMINSIKHVRFKKMFNHYIVCDIFTNYTLNEKEQQEIHQELKNILTKQYQIKKIDLSFRPLVSSSKE